MATEVVSPGGATAGPRGRRPSRAGWDLALGAAIGYCASRVMDRATTWYRGRQGEASRRLEDEVAPGGGLVLAGRALAGAVGREVTEEEARRIGLVVHRSLGVSYGIAAAALGRRGTGPLRAGLIAGTAAFLLVDEGVNSAFFTLPPQDYPVESHLRGIVGHFTYGVVAGALLAAARRLGAIRP